MHRRRFRPGVGLGRSVPVPTTNQQPIFPPQPLLLIIFMDTNPTEAREHLRQAIHNGLKAREEFLRTSKYRRNARVPVSRLPPETLATIFALLSHSVYDEKRSYMKWLHITHVCHYWREIALGCSHLWSYINLNKLNPASIPEIVARAKMSPLHLEANTTYRNKERFGALERLLEAHISHTRQLTISGELRNLPERLVSPAPALEHLSLSSFDYAPSAPVITDTFFAAAPNLTNLELDGYGISWKIPLKGLRTLKMKKASKEFTLNDWLDALNEMPQLETLVLHNAGPEVSHDSLLTSGPRRTVTHPSLTRFNISASAKGCALALIHLALPALTSLQVTANSHCEDGEDVRLLIPYVVRNANGPQDTTPLQSMLLTGESSHAEIFAWVVPDADLEVPDLPTPLGMPASPCPRLAFSAWGNGRWRNGMNTMVFDTILVQLPLNAISTLTVQSNYTRWTEEFWLRHAPRLAMLKRARLAPTAVKAFKTMLVGDVSPNGPRWFPRLIKLILVGVSLTAVRTYHLRDMLVKRKEHGAALEVLDLPLCIAAEHAIRLLAEAAGNVQGSVTWITPGPGNREFFDWRGGVDLFDEEEEYDDMSNCVSNSDENGDSEEEVMYWDEYDIPFDLHHDQDDGYGYYYEYYSL